MNKAPERIWALWDDAYDVGVDKVEEYVRADHIKELEKRINDLSADKINLRSENMELKAKLAKTEVIK